MSVTMGVVNNFILYSLLFGFAYTVDVSVKSKIDEYGIVPDVIDVAPDDLLQITFPSGAKANLGNELTPTEAKDIPSLTWNAEDKALYAVLLTDPDAPAHIKEFRHWLIVNIPGNDISKGKIVYDFVGAGPPKGSGLHRYIFLVFKQPNLIETDTYVPNTTREGRTQTKARDLIKEHNLGVPIAGNFYRAQYDDYVPIVHAQLGGPPKAN